MRRSSELRDNLENTASVVEPTPPLMTAGPKEEKPIRDWNVAFLVRHYPVEIAVQGPEFFMVKIGEDFLRAFRDFTKKVCKGEPFVGSFPADQFMWFGVRVRSHEALEAVVQARHRVEGFIDASALTIETTTVARICDIVWLSTAGQTAMRMHEFHYDDWINYVHGGPEDTAAWNARTNELRARLILFYELAADTHSKAQSELGFQLRHSLRMFRYGIESRCFGVEFICKFCALEGLVCGNAKAMKKRLLLDRLGALFRSDPSAKTLIEEFWNYRSEAVHTAQAFDNGTLDQGAVLGVHIEPLSRIFRAAVVFALDHLHEVGTVDELWSKVSGYAPPSYAIMQRPKGMEQYVTKNMLMPLNASAPEHGMHFDDLLANSRARVAEHQAKERPKV